MLCLLCPLTTAYALPIETKLDTAAQTVAVLDASELQVTLPAQSAETLPEQIETEDGQLLWPMMPSDTLAQLAKTFYPDSPILEQRFIQKAIRLTKALGVTLLPDTPFKRVQVIAIPDEKEVRAVTHRIKRLQEITHAQNQLQLSYQLKLSGQLKSIIPPAPKPNKTVAQKQTVPAKPVLASAPVPSATPWVGVWQQAQSIISGGKLQLTAAITRFTQILAQPQSRNVLYLALLLFTGLGLWCLQKRYMRRQIALLNTATTMGNTPPALEAMPDNVTQITAYQVQEEDRTAAA